MAIRVLLDHGVRQDHIVFVTLVVARGGGISILRRAFPQVKIICATVDENMQEGWAHGDGDLSGEGRKVWTIQPGMGQLGQCFPCSFSECCY
jgi:uridine kinase